MATIVKESFSQTAIGGNTKPDEESSQRIRNWEEAKSCVSLVLTSEGYNRKTPGNGSWKSNWQLPLFPSMAQQRIGRDAGSEQEVIHLHLANTEGQHQNWHHLLPECHLRQPVTLQEFQDSKSKLCHTDRYPCLYLFPTLHVQKRKLPIIESTKIILFQICWRITWYPLVSTQSGAWQCSSHRFRWQEQPVETTCRWRQALINQNRILEWIIIDN